MEAIIWIDGRLVRESEAGISPFDHGFTVGDGVFETMVTREGRPFAVRRHFERLARSCAGAGLPVPERGRIEAALASVLEANRLSEARLRVTVTGGRAPLGSGRGESIPTVVVAAAARVPWAAVSRVAIVPWPRNERGALSGIKSTSYGENVVALAWAQARGADEGIFLNTRGELCEGTGSNIFVVRDGTVRTPGLDSGCLAGVTRALVIELGRSARVAVTEGVLGADEVRAADEVFLTSSTRDIHPVGWVDGEPAGAAPGPMTSRLMEVWSRMLASGNIDP